MANSTNDTAATTLPKPPGGWPCEDTAYPGEPKWFREALGDHVRWWRAEYGDDAAAEWADNCWIMLTTPQRHALEWESGHHASLRVLRRRGLLDDENKRTSAGRWVRLAGLRRTKRRVRCA